MPPQFQNENQAKVYEKVATILKEQFGAQARANDTAPQFNIRAGSAWVTVVTISSVCGSCVTTTSVERSGVSP